MRAKRRTEQEQYEIIMECRQSGLSDHQWCLEHDINPGTFYNWVRRFRKQACEFPELAEKDRFQAIHQEIVKMEIIPDQSTDYAFTTVQKTFVGLIRDGVYEAKLWEQSRIWPMQFDFEEM